MKNFAGSLSGMAAEFRGVMRGMMRKPGYAIAAWIMLGLAVAANAAVFAIVWGFLLKPLPYPQPNQLSMVRELVPKIGLTTPLVSVKTYVYLKHNLNGVTSVGLATHAGGSIVKMGGRTHFLKTQQVTPSMFRTLGVTPIIGRLPSRRAGQPGGPPEAMISWHFWQSAYDGSQTILNHPIKLGEETYRIVGVMPKGFSVVVPGRDVWLPFVMTPERANNGNINYYVLVRRKPGVSRHQLNLELQNQVQRLLAAEKPSARARDIQAGYTIDARPPREVGLNRSGIGHLPWLLQAAAGLLLLLALANTINLGLVRQRMRQHDFALRRVLGASRSGLVRLIMMEHIPLVLAVGGSATLLAWAAINTLQAFGLPSASSPFQVELGAPVIIFTWVLAVIATLIVAFGPALLATGKKLLQTIGHGPTAVGGHAARRLQQSLGTIQVALACALVVAGGCLP